MKDDAVTGMAAKKSGKQSRFQAFFINRWKHLEKILAICRSLLVPQHRFLLCRWDKDAESCKNVSLRKKREAREDVNEYFLCEYDYTQSGFTAVLSEKKLKDGVYEILLRPEGRKKAYSTNVYYDDGKMTFANPEEFVPLNVAGTDLETVVENGVLRVYRPDFGMYVYQYEGELYWIAENWYDFVEDNTYIQYQMDTTQVENLPKDRLDHGWYWSNIGFYFKTKELTEWNTGNYCVAKSALPTEYSITKIYTGNHTDGIPEAYKSNYTPGWIWLNLFRPWYVFN